VPPASLLTKVCHRQPKPTTTMISSKRIRRVITRRQRVTDPRFWPDGLTRAGGLRRVSIAGALPWLFNPRERHAGARAIWSQSVRLSANSLRFPRRSTDGRTILDALSATREPGSDLRFPGAPLRNRTVDLLLTIQIVRNGAAVDVSRSQRLVHTRRRSGVRTLSIAITLWRSLPPCDGELHGPMTDR
jgi:hypothetical protein